jgi:hypothetical protein
VWDRAGVEFVADEFQHGDELGKDEDFVAFGGEGFEGIEQGFEFGGERGRAAGSGEFRFRRSRGGSEPARCFADGSFGRFDADEAGIAADLAEAKQGLKDVEALGVEIAVIFYAEEQGARAFEFGVVKSALGAGEVDFEVLLDARGEVAGDLIFCAAEEEVFDALGEAGAGGRVGLVVVEPAEGGLAAEEAGLGEGEEAPEIEEAILHGRAGEDEAVRGAEGAGSLGGGASGVFDVLAFVEDDCVPRLGGEGFGVEAELGVVEDEELRADG